MATVLIVDDDPINREYLRTLLGHRGHQVHEAADGDAALVIVDREPCDAVITDVLMPGIDGYELARILRARPSTRRVPIAFSTAHYAEHEIRPLALACGVQGVILKPAEPMAVLAAIEVLLGGGAPHAAVIPGPVPEGRSTDLLLSPSGEALPGGRGRGGDGASAAGGSGGEPTGAQVVGVSDGSAAAVSGGRVVGVSDAPAAGVSGGRVVGVSDAPAAGVPGATVVGVSDAPATAVPGATVVGPLSAAGAVVSDPRSPLRDAPEFPFAPLDLESPDDGAFATRRDLGDARGSTVDCRPDVPGSTTARPAGSGSLPTQRATDVELPMPGQEVHTEPGTAWDSESIVDGVSGTSIVDHFAAQYRLMLNRKLLEKTNALTLAEKRLWAMAEAVPVGMLLASADGMACHVNPWLARLLGERAEDLLGAGWLECLEPVSRQQLVAAVKAGQPYDRRPFRVATRGARTGRRWLDIALRAVDDSTRNGFVATVEDVTGVSRMRERMRALDEWETVLRRQITYLAGRLAETQRVAGTGTWDLDSRTGAIVLSPGLADAMHLPHRRIKPAALWQRVHPDDREAAIEAANIVIRTGEPQAVELRVADLDGRVHELIVSCRPVTLRQGQGGDQVRGLWGVAQDVTAIREEQRARQREQSDLCDELRVRDELQRALLPDSLPVVPEVDLGATYRPAVDREDIGGDWYDALHLPDGAVLLSVGDVHGQDDLPAAVMGAVRAATRAYAIEDADPGALLTRLNRFLMATYDDGVYVTTTIARYDPASRSLQVAMAGYPLPLLATPDRLGAPAPTVVPVGQAGPPLGVVATTEYPVHRVSMPPGSALCLYTDGLIERHEDLAPPEITGFGNVIGQAIARSNAGGARPGSVAQQLVDVIVDAMLIDSPPDDDACMAMLRVPRSQATHRTN